MTPVSFFSPSRRRSAALCALVVALHLLVIGWVGVHMGAPGGEAPKPAPLMITAQLLPASPQPVVAAPAPPVPPVRKKPRPKPAPAKPAPAPAEAVADSGLSGAPPVGDMPAGDVTVGDMPPDAPPTAPAPASAAAVAAPPAAAPLASVAPPAGPRRYNVNLPASAEFDLEVRRVDADGTQWSGAAAMSWRRDDAHYKVKLEAGLSMLIARINLLVLTSEGEIDDAGIAPVTATEKRKGRSMTATHFNRSEQRITFSASEGWYPLPAGAQDKASLPFQLSGIGRADVNQLAGDIDIFVGEDKEANIFRFKLVGEEELETKMGRLVTWHLSRPPKPGSYSSRLDIWLAPDRNWYPVQIRNTEASGGLTTQTVTKITVIEPLEN